MRDKVAYSADVCYNKPINIVAPAVLETPKGRINLSWRSIMTTVSHHAYKSNVSPRQCAHPECHRVIKPSANYCRNHYPPPSFKVFNDIVYLIMANGVVAIIDEADKDEITHLHWFCNGDGYAVREVEIGKIMGKIIREIAYMHRVIM